MDIRLEEWRTYVRHALMAIGLLGIIRRTRRRIRGLVELLLDPAFRRQRKDKLRRFQQFKEQYGSVLKGSLAAANANRKTVLIVSRSFRYVALQLALLKALELAGFRPVVLVEPTGRWLPDCYSWAGIDTIHDWRTFTDCIDFAAAAEAIVAKCNSVEDLLGFEHSGSRCGKIAVSVALRQVRAGSLDLQSPRIRRILANQLASAMAAATAAQTVLRKVRPQLVVSFNVEYTPGAEIFDNCMEQGIDVVTYRDGHKDNIQILRRCSARNRDQNPVSLSEESWHLVRSMAWTDAHRNALRRELHDNYASANWYAVVGTQFNTRFMDAGTIRKRLGISPQKKTAFIFAHIPWDASLRWGQDLFGNYEEWLVETVRAAALNDRVNWVIRIHPANVGKQLKGRYQEEPAEVLALRRRLGTLPPHIFLLRPDSDISTYSLLGVVDYCVTVRGTIGIEAASFGIPVVTAGSGRYEGKGFTIDSGSREQYLERIICIHEIGRLSPDQRELAERYAYGLFLMRPFPFRSLSLEFSKDYGVENGFTRIGINVKDKEGWRQAPDLKALAQWINNSANPDYLGAASLETPS